MANLQQALGAALMVLRRIPLRQRQAGLPPRREKHFQQAIVDVARMLGFLVHHQYDARRSEPGLPDLLIVGHGRCIHAEIKVPGGQYSKYQRAWLAELLGTQCEVYTWISGVDDIRQIARILEHGPHAAA